MACAPDSDGKGKSSGPEGYVKADLRSEGDAALAALAAERMSLWERAGPADWVKPSAVRAGAVRGQGDGAGAFGCPLSTWKGTAWEIARSGESGEKRRRARR